MSEPVGKFPCRSTLCKFLVGQIDAQCLIVGIDSDRISIVYESYVSSRRRLGRDVSDDHSVCSARKSAVSDQADGIAESEADDRGCWGKHLAHSGTAFRAFVTDNYDIACLDL